MCESRVTRPRSDQERRRSARRSAPRPRAPSSDPVDGLCEATILHRRSGRAPSGVSPLELDTREQHVTHPAPVKASRRLALTKQVVARVLDYRGRTMTAANVPRRPLLPSPSRRAGGTPSKRGLGETIGFNAPKALPRRTHELATLGTSSASADVSLRQVASSPM
jgi:hypothetical protein